MILEGDSLKYRCNICTTKSQPQGKLNKLASGKFVLKSVKKFLTQHLDSNTHVRKARAQSNTDREENKIPSIECPGFCASLHLAFCFLLKGLRQPLPYVPPEKQQSSITDQ